MEILILILIVAVVFFFMDDYMRRTGKRKSNGGTGKYENLRNKTKQILIIIVIAAFVLFAGIYLLALFGCVINPGGCYDWPNPIEIYKKFHSYN